MIARKLATARDMILHQFPECEDWESVEKKYKITPHDVLRVLSQTKRIKKLNMKDAKSVAAMDTQVFLIFILFYLLFTYFFQ